MYNPVENGSVEVVAGIECQLPPVGYGVDRITGELKYIGVHSRAAREKEQKWERIELPKDYANKRRKEEIRQQENPEYFDPELENVRHQHYTWRRCGFWFKNNGKETYITGTHWFYLNWCRTNIGYMDYRDTDRRLFYVMAYSDADPRSCGVVYVGRRQCGKTYIANAWMLDRVSLARNKHGGIQSKGDDDAQKVFNKLVNYFVYLPHFFRPVYDQTQGLRAKKSLRFFRTNKKGKDAEEVLDEEELMSWIDYGPSDSFHYDGDESMYAYVLDEFGKPQRYNVRETWDVIRPCIDKEGRRFGKAFVTSTIEDLDTTGHGPLKLWKDSDQKDRDENGMTMSGMYRVFFGAHESTFFDEYGLPDIEKGLKYYNNMRARYHTRPRDLSSIIRKNPFTVEEAFRIDSDKCLFDSMKLNERLDVLSWKDNIYEIGNFVWANGERDTKVVWEPGSGGRWKVARALVDTEKWQQSNRVVRIGENCKPNNKHNFVAGADPIDHGITEDGRRSNGACCIYQKHNENNGDDPYNSSFVALYCYRPDSAAIYYEDVLKACVYYGCQVLVENQKIGIVTYFNDRGYGDFLMWLKDRNQAGIAASPKTHQYIAELTEDYINNYCDRVYFKDLITDWLHFDISDTTRFDAAMAAGYTLIADREKMYVRDIEKVYDVGAYFKSYKLKR